MTLPQPRKIDVERYIGSFYQGEYGMVSSHTNMFTRVYFFQKSKIKINIKDKILCAKYRKGHFEGVIDVMSRLTEMIKPKKIFMG